MATVGDHGGSAASSAQLNAALLAFQKATRDEERFASLLVLAKLGAADRPDVAARVYHEIGTRYIRRLLTSSVPAGVPPHAFKSVGLAVLGSMTAAPEVAQSPDVLELVDPVLDALEDVSCTPELDLDALVVLSRMVGSPEGRAALLRRGADRTVTARLLGPPAADETAAAMAIPVLLQLVDDSGHTGVRCGSERVVAVVAALATAFEQRQDRGKFAACAGLGQLLDLVRGSFDPTSATVVAVARHAGWKASVATGLREVLSSKLGPTERNDALRLAALTTEFAGGVAWATSVAKLVPLLGRYASVEIRMALEDRSLADAVASAPIVAGCYVVCEAVIALLAEDGPDAHSLDLAPEVMVGLHTALGEAAEAALALLETAVSELAAPGDISHSDPSTRSLLLASVRLAGAWLAEESASTNTRRNESIPMLLRVAAELDPTPQELGGGGADSGGDGGGGGGGDDDPSSVGVALRWLLPGACHITADDAGRDAFVAAGGHAAVADVLLDSWLPSLVLAAQRSSSSSSLPIELVRSCSTACAVLLNIAVLAPDVVRSSPVFRDLRDRLLPLVVALGFRSDPLMFANAATLLLRTLLHVPWIDGDRPPAGDLQRFAEALAPWAAYRAGGSDDDDGDDVVELWALAKQALDVAAERDASLARARDRAFAKN